MINLLPVKLRQTIIYRNLRRFVKFGLRYGNFSFNLNSRRYWNAKLAQYGDSWRDENYHHVLGFLPKAKPFSLLDIGCALGDGCELLQKEFPKATISGADISEVGITKAQKKAKDINYFVMDILEDEIPEIYDYITIIETLEHFDDPYLVVDKCLTHVKKSVIISVPYALKPFSGRIAGVGEHRYSFTRDTFNSYNHRNIKITDYIEATKSSCIIYELEP